MKKFFYLAIMAFVTLGMTACGDDNEGSTPSGTSGLVGSEWVYSESESEMYEGVTYEYTVAITIKFLTASTGSLVYDMSATANGTPAFSESDSEDFTYTYDGSGSGTMSAVDEETGEIDTIPFTINGNELTISDYDEETGEMMTIVFTRK